MNQSKGAGSARQAERSQAGACDLTYTAANPGDLSEFLPSFCQYN